MNVENLSAPMWPDQQVKTSTLDNQNRRHFASEYTNKSGSFFCIQPIASLFVSCWFHWANSASSPVAGLRYLRTRVYGREYLLIGRSDSRNRAGLMEFPQADNRLSIAYSKIYGQRSNPWKFSGVTSLSTSFKINNKPVNREGNTNRRIGGKEFEIDRSLLLIWCQPVWTRLASIYTTK